MTCESNVLDHSAVSFDRIGVLPWCFILWLLWFLLYTIYEKFSLVLLRRTLMSKEDADALVYIYWNICFSALSVPTTVANMGLVWSDFLDLNIETLESRLAAWWPPTTHNSPVLPLHLRLTFVLLAGFYLNRVAQISVLKGFSHPSFLAAESFLIFFISTYTLRCVLFGMAIVCITNIVQLTLDVCRIFLRLASSSTSKFLEFFTYFFMATYSFAWCVAFLHVVPTWGFLVMGLAYNGLAKFQQDVTHALCLVALCLTLWSYYLLEVYESPITKYFLSLLADKRVNIRFHHFIVEEKDEYSEDEMVSCNTVQLELQNGHDTSQPNITNGSEMGTIITPIPNLGMLEEKQVTRKNLKVVYQTIKCYMVFKKKIRNMRAEQKARVLTQLSTKETGSQDAINKEDGNNDSTQTTKSENTLFC